MMSTSLAFEPRCTCGEHASTTRPGAGRTLSDHVRAILRTIAAWRARSRQRRDLSLLDDRLLKDIGISRSEARIEEEKPFWQ